MNALQIIHANELKTIVGLGFMVNFYDYEMIWKTPTVKTGSLITLN